MHSSNIAPSNGYSAQDPPLNFATTSLMVTKQDFKAMISGLDDPVGDQTFDETWRALIATNGHLTSDALAQFNTSPLKIEREALKATIGGLGDPVDEQAFDGFWESLAERVQQLTYVRKKLDEVYHGDNKENQTNINSVSRKRKADGDVAEPHSDIESTSKKQKLAAEVDDSAIIDGVNDALLFQEAEERVHHLPQISKRKRSNTKMTKAEETVSTTNPTVPPTPASHPTTPPPTSNKRTYLPHLSTPSLAPAFTSLKRLNIALIPYKYRYFTDAEIARDDALYAPLPVPEPQPTTFFGTEEEQRLRRLFPAFELSGEGAMEEDPLALFEASWEGKVR